VIKPAKLEVRPRKRNFSSLIIMMRFGFFVLNFMAPQQQVDAIKASKVNEENQRANTRFQCEGKNSCAELSACDEATFYVENCPDVLVDMSSLACKTQWCSVD
jgi:hypothetical protein